MGVEEVHETGKRLSNWGRWGADDELGTLNFITPEKVVQAGALVRTGKSFGLAIPFDRRGPQSGGGRFNPLYFTTLTGADIAVGGVSLPGGVGFHDDVVVMPLQAGTQWDSLSHAYYDGKLYNGFESAEITSRGARHNGIEVARDRVVTRGVLLDIARHRGVDWLEPGTPITPDDLDACAAAQGVEVGSGDALLVRTGAHAQARAAGSWGTYAGGDAAGLSFSTAGWLHDREVACVATDTWGMEVRPNEIEGTFQPLHMVLIRDMGMLIGEIWYLDELAADCATDGVWEFMLAAPPLPFTGAAGSPLNPMAIK